MRERALLLGVTLAIAGALQTSNLFLRWDRLAYDSSLQMLWRAPPNDIVIVGVDNQSLQKIGRWPWSRQVPRTASLLRGATATPAAGATRTARIRARSALSASASSAASATTGSP